MKKPYIVILLIAVLVAAYFFFINLNRHSRNERVLPTGDNLPVDKTDEIPKEEEATTGEIKVGETKTINGVRITLNKIVEDSRCPSDVVCIWAGRLVVNATLRSDTDYETLDLTMGTVHDIDTFHVSVVGTSHTPKSTMQVPHQNYKVIFKVEAR